MTIGALRPLLIKPIHKEETIKANHYREGSLEMP